MVELKKPSFASSSSLLCCANYFPSCSSFTVIYSTIPTLLIKSLSDFYSASYIRSYGDEHFKSFKLFRTTFLCFLLFRRSALLFSTLFAYKLFPSFGLSDLLDLLGEVLINGAYDLLLFATANSLPNVIVPLLRLLETVVFYSF